MLNSRFFVPAAFCLALFTITLNANAQATSSAGCSGTNGSRFNLEPRTNAVVQAARSVAVLPNRVAPDVDLIVATAVDARSLGDSPSPDAFYVDRSNANCTPDFEGGLPFIDSPGGAFAPSGYSTVVADPARDAFFVVDVRFATAPDMNGVGIIRTPAANLLNPATCPNGTQIDGRPCWATGAVTNIVSIFAAFLYDPHIAVDPRTKGVGAGDVYAVVTQTSASGSGTAISLSACTNLKLSCSASVTISGSDQNAGESFVQVRPDGLITISYRNTVFPGVHPEDIKFVVCTPQGAPRTPTCAAPTIVTTEMNPIVVGMIGDVPTVDSLYPRHVNRLESDGHSVTTFLVYDRCAVAQIPALGASPNFCPKTEVVMTFSVDGGSTWSAINTVSASAGQQFFGNLALDLSTSTVNIAYYSTENDFFQQNVQIFLAQIHPGSTAVHAPTLLTTGMGDVGASSPIIVTLQPAGFGDRIGVAAAGSGSAGGSRAYVGFTWNSVSGDYGGVPSPDVNNHLTVLSY